MPTDNQAAKSYIEAVMARADGATGGPWKIVRTSGAMGPCHYIDAGTEREPSLIEAWSEANEVFIAHARQDIPTLAKMLLRAVEGLHEMRIRNSWFANVHADELLAEINAMAKGSQ